MNLVQLANDEFIKKAYELNPNKDPLTIEKLKAFTGCEDYTDEEAAGIMQTLENLSAILFESNFPNNSICNDNQRVVYLDNDANTSNHAA